MGRKDKTKTKKKSKEGLSTADILKLIKKLKPKNQQIVKVNLGEDMKKKKKGEVQSSYNPPFVFPQQGYPAITSLGQPPYKPLLIEEPRQAATWSSQPAKEPQQLMPPPPQQSTLYITEGESEIEIIPRRKSKKAAATPEYKVRQPYGTSEPKLKTGLTFNEPKFAQPSNLSEASAIPTRFYQPVANDKYQADIIQTNPAGDQIGTLADKISSSLWTGTPEGDITLTVEEKQTAAEADIVSPENIFLQEPTYEELQQEQIQKVAVPIQGVSAPLKEQKVEVGFKAIVPRIYIDEINKAVRNDNYIITGVPEEYISTRGATKGQIKQTAKNKLMSNDIDPVYKDMLTFTGRLPKKAEFIIKKAE
jgi:hypothetical protein